MILAHSACTEDRVNMRDQHGDTALHDAVTHGFEAAARVLIEQAKEAQCLTDNDASLDIASHSRS